MPTELALPLPIDDLRTILRAHGVTRAQLFGSYARGEQTPDSDVDILVEVSADASLFDVIGAQLELQDRTGVGFELLTAIREPFRPYIEPDLVDLSL